MRADKVDLNARIAEIDSLDRDGCLDLWREIFGRPPPKHLSPQFMRRVLLHEVQTRVLGRVSRTTEQRLKNAARGRQSATIARSGSRLLRERNGRTSHFEVLDGVYLMDGKSWRSLSAIAGHITGARWSGPRFFRVQ